MANRDDSKGVKFIWKIVNFSCNKGGILESPHFSWNSTTWKVTIDQTGFPSLKVELRQLQRKLNKSLRCSLSLLDSQGYPLVGNDEWFFLEKPRVKSITCSEVFGARRKDFLPNDILTIQCHMRKAKLFIEHVPLLFALTRIAPLDVAKKSFIWNVADVLSSNYNTYERVELMTINGKSLSMKLNLKCSNGLEISTLTLSLIGIRVKATISVLDTLGKKIQLVDKECLSNKNSKERNVGTILTENMLRCHRSAFVNNDILSLYFCFTFTLPGNITFNSLIAKDEMPNIDVGHIFESFKCSVESEIETSNRLDNSGTVSKAFQGMYEEGFLSDFNLRVEDRLFPVHKAVLGMRSPVFRVMFTTEMIEKKGKESVIKDIDGDTLHRMLQFIYSDKVEEDTSLERASRLYEAADKYVLEPLKQRCSAILGSGMCVASALDILKLADMHNDQELKSSAYEFISRNEDEIVGSEQWDRFEEENRQLVLDTTHVLYLRSVLKKRNKRLCVRGAQGTTFTKPKP